MSNSSQFKQVLTQWVQIFMHRSMQGFTQWMTESGLSRTQIGALMCLHHQGQTAVSGIGSNLGISTPAASQLVDRLVHMQLITRSDHPNDRRVKIIALTDQGISLLHEALQARLDWMEEIASILPKSEQTEVTNALQILVTAASKINKESHDMKNIIEQNRINI